MSSCAHGVVSELGALARSSVGGQGVGQGGVARECKEQSHSCTHARAIGCRCVCMRAPRLIPHWFASTRWLAWEANHCVQVSFVHVPCFEHGAQMRKNVGEWRAMPTRAQGQVHVLLQAWRARLL